MGITACGWWLCLYLFCASTSTTATPTLDPGAALLICSNTKLGASDGSPDIGPMPWGNKILIGLIKPINRTV